MKIAPRLFTLAFAFSMALFAAAPAAQAEFAFKKGDRIAYIGNALADRMQHDGWLETLLQSEQPDKELVFRNLGFVGDQVAHRPRNKDFPTAEFYLQHVKADVIFAFFGYNESFAGDAGLPKFKEDLSKMIDSYRALKPNGESEPRIVLFSPIAHEDLKSPNLPDGKANNERLAKYTAAIAEVAQAKNTGYVDLFTTSQKRYEASEAPLTINGVHLSTEGNRQIGEVIAESLLGKKVAAAESLESLRKAVVDKNWHWFNRYRATDGNDIWGSRADLKFVKDQTNREVLQHELIMLDVMSANRDQRVWALARGSDLAVDDSNVPRPIPVESNVGGKSSMSSKEKEGNLDYVSGEAGIAKMKVPEGFKVNLFADESRFPELANPVQLQVDGKGRLWAAAWKTYPKWEPLKEMDDRLLIFPDDDRDGVADRCITFAKVHNPLGFEFWGGGVIVTRQPDILFLKDTDGDDVADVEIVIMQGIDSADTHHAANNLIFGPDGGIYYQSGIFKHNNIEHPWGPSLSTGASAMYRFDPRRFTIGVIADNSPNPHGTAFDRWGYLYATDGTGGRAYQVRPEGKGFKMYELLKKQVRPVPASEILSSAHFPDEMQQNFLICNAIGFLGIKQYKLNRDGGSPYTRESGSGKDKKVETLTTRLGEVWGEPVEDLLVSEDKNFRPADAIVGEDGALYVADWHNVIIGHMQHNIRDPNRDHKHGRIYRMTYPARPLQAPVKIDGASLPELMANLQHPVDGVRHRTRVELSERPTAEVIAACKEWMKQFDPANKDHAHALLEALWLHQQHNVRNTELLNSLLKSPEPHARVAATTVQHFWFNVDHTGGGSTGSEHDPLAQPDQKSGVISDTPDLTEVRIGTIIERMRYDVQNFQVKAGKKIKLTFANPDFLPHNLVITQPKAADEVAIAAIQLAEKGFALGFVPDHPKVLFHTKLLDHKGEEVLEFNAPDQPGDYEFVCTFPGHHLLMRGIMKVVK
ncbi:MAG: cytochrome C precursor [Verrucomicrobiales bacterium]|nr:cytochrome C precursor [Verrucomicrobiales bacterium]